MFSNGSVYIGSFENDFLNGKKSYKGYGKMNYSNGDQYSGYFINGKREGKGVYKCKNGDILEGVFFKD